ncbi:naringenin-chalcone synthase [Rufibacter radiotolerans]|uniref:Naringenin-chalcone synthase n=1 Tax=Rufibacter radiotolerans TaxID=1379910 RepID=A0A0H4VMY6_9BACT|nr:type III polyketide synthase [Rufibacter radiotolerans]AKQ46683.1 naringenin-chalcone synthase [Rufibacter radiotolerans]
MKSYLCAIGTANPPHALPQQQIADFMAEALQLDAQNTRKLKALYRVSGIDQRHTVLPDYGRQNGDYEFYPNSPGLEPFPTVGARMLEFQKAALPLSVAAVQDCLAQLPNLAVQEITHLITVSCTGMYAPGLDIELVDALGLSPQVQRTCVYFMGCYAAFNALKLADTICRADADARVLIVCTELCTLHFQKQAESDHLVSNALFADGAAAVVVCAQPLSGLSLGVEAFHCDLAPSGQKEMAWHIHDFGFEMTLSSYVPALIKQGIGQLTQSLLQKLNLQLDQIDLFAIHPGGRKILEVIEQALGLTPQNNQYAYQVLRNYGNMSSATVLFVLRALWEDLQPAQQQAPILSFAFGPGLTLESMLLSVHYV